ncbi:hypothetical protein [Rhizobium sp. CC-YZS058]|uniref:hypothetical protein n=1 Tax=Rhizobium sp. CC-YZS058 TaxID=3042153 RepID=UPI002B056662|nr:hypothetical protein [Rhizobium sp. CC-YZS058]MEA3534558.1 hypothetical protein [Rhizobium sp. CC-YZS058]
MTDEKKPRRKRGEAALGNIDRTKIVAGEIIDQQRTQREAKTERLRALRLAAGEAGHHA